MNLITQYLNNTISIEELIHSMDTQNFTQSEIKKHGIIYTPKYISDYIVLQLKPKLNETVFEPSIGHGIFIISLLEYIQNTFKLTHLELIEYFNSNIFGGDIQINNIKEFSDIIIAFFQNIGCKDTTLLKFNHFTTSNTLEQNKYFDIILGNPPYVRIQLLEKKELKFLRTEFQSCKKGNIDLYYAFIEYAYKNSSRCSLITPNSWLYNASGNNLRKLVKNDICNIIDFKEKQIFKTAATYTSIFVIDKVYDSKSLCFQTDINKKTIPINKTQLNDDRWTFNSKKINSNIEIIKIHSPIATLRDKIFIEPGFTNKDTIDFYKISKFKKKEDFVDKKSTIISPYIFKNGSFRIKEIKEFDSKTLKYLENYKNELNKRDKGKTSKYEAWYAFGRKQGLNIYKQDSFIIPIPGMISYDYEFFSQHIEDLKRPFLFSSGFLLEVNKSNLTQLIKFLNSQKFRKYLENNGKIWKGTTSKTSYYSLTIKQLNSLF